MNRKVLASARNVTGRLCFTCAPNWPTVERSVRTVKDHVLARASDVDTYVVTSWTTFRLGCRCLPRNNTFFSRHEKMLLERITIIRLFSCPDSSGMWDAPQPGAESLSTVFDVSEHLLRDLETRSELQGFDEGRFLLISIKYDFALD
jgi:hypothetical protein